MKKINRKWTMLCIWIFQGSLLLASDPIEPYLETGESGQFRYAIYNNQWLLQGQQWIDEKHITRVAIVGLMPGAQGELSIPSSIKGYEVYGIDEKAFEPSLEVTGIRIPKTIRFLRPGTFSRCAGLLNIFVAEDHPDYTSVDGVMFNKPKTKLLAFGCGRSGEYTIPGTITEIGPSAFAMCDKLTCVKIPSSVVDIGGRDGGVFQGCSRLEKIELPDSVANIGQKSFQDCRNLKEVVVPPKMTSIPFGLFWRCSRLTRVNLPEGITNIGNYAFADCVQMTLRHFPESLVTIGAYAFKDCKSLRGLKVPKNVTTIGRAAFRGSEVEIPGQPGPGTGK